MLFFVAHLRTCHVSFCDPQGHGRFTVTVTAASKYEAAASALQLFRKETWCTEAAYATGYLDIEVQEPSVQYKVLLDDLTRWLEGRGGSPRDRALREKVKSLLR